MLILLIYDIDKIVKIYKTPTDCRNQYYQHDRKYYNSSSNETYKRRR
jgi:hypothetical protein